MPISFRCACGRQLKTKEEFAGRKVKCPACGQVAIVPANITKTDHEAPVRPEELKQAPLREERPRRRLIGYLVGAAIVLLVGVVVGLMLAPPESSRPTDSEVEDTEDVRREGREETPRPSSSQVDAGAEDAEDGRAQGREEPPRPSAGHSAKTIDVTPEPVPHEEPATEGEAAKVVRDSQGHDLLISAPSERFLQLSGGSAFGPFGPSTTFELPVENKSGRPIKVTVVCDLLYKREKGKEHFDVMCFHEALVQPGPSEVNLHFQTLGMTLRGKGDLRVHFAKHFIPKPKPQRIMSLVVGAEVYILNKPVNVTYPNIDLTPISNTIRIPVVTDPKYATDIPKAPARESARKPATVFLALEHTFTGHVVSVTSIAFSPDGKRIASCGEYRNSLDKREPYPLYVWNVGAKSMLWNPSEEKAHLYSVLFLSNDTFLSGAQGDRSARLWSLRSRKEERRFVGHRGTVSNIVCLPSGKEIVTASTDGTLGLWNVGDASLKKKIEAGCAYPCPLALSPEGDRVITADKQGRLHVWDPNTWQEIMTIGAHTDTVEDIDISPDGALVLSCSHDNSARVSQLAQGTRVAQFSVNGRKRAQGAFLGEGKHVLVGDDLYDMTTKSKVQSLGMESVRAIAISPDTQRVATGGGGHDKVIRLWRYHPEGVKAD